MEEPLAERHVHVNADIFRLVEEVRTVRCLERRDDLLRVQRPYSHHAGYHLVVCRDSMQLAGRERAEVEYMWWAVRWLAWRRA